MTEGASDIEGREAVSALPESIKIGPYFFRIVRLTVSKASASAVYGQCSTQEMEIRIQESFTSSYKAVSTLIHEALHALHWIMDIEEKDNEEHRCTVLATGLTMLFTDNKWLASWVAKYTGGFGA